MEILKDNIAIILVISNVRGWTEVCIESLKRQKNIENLQTIFVFNGTNKFYKKQILKIFSPTNQIEFEKNVALPKAFNDAIKIAEKDWVLLLHNDTIIPNNFFDNIVAEANVVLERDEAVLGFLPVTNYSNEANAIINNDMYLKYLEYKPSNKSIVIKDNVLEILEKYYDNDKKGLDALDEFSKTLITGEMFFSYLPEISHYCLLVNKESFNIAGYFDEDFYPIGFFEKIFFEKLMMEGYGFVSLKNCYVHHNGNTSSDYFGFNLHTILTNNEKLFERKNQERDNKIYLNLHINVEDSNQGTKAAFVFLGNDTLIKNFKDEVSYFSDYEIDADTSIDIYYSSMHEEMIKNNLSDLKVNLISTEIDLSNDKNEESFKEAEIFVEALRQQYDIVKDWSINIYYE